MRSNPDQLGSVIHQTRSPAYAEVPEERWDRTYATWPKESQTMREIEKKTKKTVVGCKQVEQHVEK